MITAADIVKPGTHWHRFNTHASVASQWHQIMTTDPAMAKGLIAFCVLLVLLAVVFTFRRRKGPQN